MFDGWCASRNVEPLRLGWSRFLNLVYYWATQGKDQKQLEAFNSELTKANNRYRLERMRKPKPRRAAEATPVVEDTRKRNLPEPPSWWTNGEEAAKQSMLVAKQLNSMSLAGKQRR